MPRPHGYHHTPETKEKIRRAMQGRRFSKTTLEKMKLAAAKRDVNGENNPAWRGGTHLSRGRVIQRVGPKRYVPRRARLVAEQVVGRPLRDDEDVHHKNGVKSDDSPDNLDVLTRESHARLHSTTRKRDTRTGRWL